MLLTAAAAATQIILLYMQARCISLLSIATSSRPQQAQHDGVDDDAAGDVGMADADAAAGPPGRQHVRLAVRCW